MFNQSHIIYLPEFYFFFAIVVLFSSGALLPLVRPIFPNSRANVLGSVSMAKLSFLSLSFLFFLYCGSLEFVCYSLVNFIFSDTLFTICLKIILVFLFSLYILSSSDLYKRDHFYFFETPLLFLISLFGMLLMISSNDLLFFYLSLELQSFCFYILAASRRRSISSVEAGLKYFVMGALASCFLLFGVSLIYAFTGSTNLASLEFFFFDSSFDFSLGAYIGVILFLSGIFFKVALAPFHSWSPDVYAGSPLLVTAFFASISKIAPFVFLLRLFSGFLAHESFIEFFPVVQGAYFFHYSNFIIFASVLSLMIGSFGAMYQSNFKRFFAYTSIAHVGYLGFALISGFESFLFYLVVYSMTNLAFFLLFFCFRSVYSDQKIFSISDLSSLFNNAPLVLGFLAFNFFSMGGIPPLVGFFSKFYVLLSLFRFEYYGSAFFLLFFSAISSFYYLKLVRLIFFDYFFSWRFYYPLPFFSIFFGFYFSLFSILFFFHPDLFYFPFVFFSASLSVQ